MRKGTTPTYTFDLEGELGMEFVAKAKFILKQGDVKLVKFLEDATIDGSLISWKLTQEETLLFKDNIFCSAQLQVVTPLGDSLVSDLHLVFVSEYLDNEVLS